MIISNVAGVYYAIQHAPRPLEGGTIARGATHAAAIANLYAKLNA